MIFVVEDDENIRELIIYTLNSTGLEAAGFRSPMDFWSALKKQQPELILLDIMLPGEDGLSVLSKLRSKSETRNIPVILATAKDSEMDKVKGFESGADDYIAKPFGMMELTARVKARLQRRCPPENNRVYQVDNLCVYPAKHTVTVDDKPVILTLKEFETLCLLLENRSVVLSRDRILNSIWGYSFDGESRTVDVHIRTLRRKLGTAGDIIETVRGVGYKIDGGSQ